MASVVMDFNTAHVSTYDVRSDMMLKYGAICHVIALLLQISNGVTLS